jgi:hypothetical protein
MQRPKREYDPPASTATPETGDSSFNRGERAASSRRVDAARASEEELIEALYCPDQRQVLLALTELGRRNVSPEINVVNALFFASGSQAVDKCCLKIVARSGNEQSLQILRKKYPRPETLQMNFLPAYLNALGGIGTQEDLECLGKIVNSFFGLYRKEALDAFERIAGRSHNAPVSAEVVRALQTLYQEGDLDEKIRILNLIPCLVNELLFAIIICGVEDDHVSIRKTAVRVLGQAETDFTRRELERHFREESEEEVLEEYARRLFLEDLRHDTRYVS